MPFIDGKEVTNEEVNIQLSLPIIAPDSTMKIDWNWISVKDRLPDLNQDVLATVIDKYDNKIKIIVCSRYERTFYKNKKEIIWDIECFCEHAEGKSEFEVMFWMPLPPMPESKE